MIRRNNGRRINPLCPCHCNTLYQKYFLYTPDYINSIYIKITILLMLFMRVFDRAALESL